MAREIKEHPTSKSSAGGHASSMRESREEWPDWSEGNGSLNNHSLRLWRTEKHLRMRKNLKPWVWWATTSCQPRAGVWGYNEQRLVQTGQLSSRCFSNLPRSLVELVSIGKLGGKKKKHFGMGCYRKRIDFEVVPLTALPFESNHTTTRSTPPPPTTPCPRVFYSVHMVFSLLYVSRKKNNDKKTKKKWKQQKLAYWNENTTYYWEKCAS